MDKYELLPKQLIHEGTCFPEDFFSPSSIDDDAVTAIHQKVYVERLKKLELNKSEIRKIGFPISKQLIEREFIIAGGTVSGALKAINEGIAFNIAGGTHHAFSSHGEAFCLLNDQAIAARYLLDKKIVKKVLIIDLDVHQGNGTAEIFQNDDRVFTFSMHGKKNYPFKKEISDLDIELDDNIEDDQYLHLLSNGIKKIDRLMSPQIIFYISGVDILSTDKLGRLNISREGCKKRDDIVYEYAHKNNIPVITSMGGGYSTKIYDIVEAHCNTFKSMLDLI